MIEIRMSRILKVWMWSCPLVGRAEVGPNCRTCGRTKANCDAEPRHCCEVCHVNGHGQ